MSTDIAKVISKIRGAERTSDGWGDAFRAFTDAARVSGAACAIFNKSDGAAEWACFAGVSEGFESAYADRYAKLDPYKPLMNNVGEWRRATEAFPRSFLKRNEWYNDFVRKSGVVDIIGCRLAETSTHFALFSVQQQLGRHFTGRSKAILEGTFGPLQASMRRQLAWIASAGRKRYFFHIYCPAPQIDDLGVSFASPTQATSFALKLAAGRAKFDECLGQFVVVVTAEGKEIARVPVERFPSGDEILNAKRRAA